MHHEGGFLFVTFSGYTVAYRINSNFTCHNPTALYEKILEFDCGVQEDLVYKNLMLQEQGVRQALTLFMVPRDIRDPNPSGWSLGI